MFTKNLLFRYKGLSCFKNRQPAKHLDWGTKNPREFQDFQPAKHVPHQGQEKPLGSMSQDFLIWGLVREDVFETHVQKLPKLRRIVCSEGRVSVKKCLVEFSCIFKI